VATRQVWAYRYRSSADALRILQASFRASSAKRGRRHGVRVPDPAQRARRRL